MAKAGSNVACHIPFTLFIRLQHLAVEGTYLHIDTAFGDVYDGHAWSHTGTETRVNITRILTNLHMSKTELRFCLVIVYLPDTIDLIELDGPL